MKRIIKKLLLEVYSIKFWVAVVVISLLCFCANVQGESASSETIVYNLMFRYTKSDFIDMGEMYSSYGVFMAFRNNYWFPIIVPMVAAIPCINRFVEEWLTGYYYMRIHRSKRVSYAIENVLIAALTGFLVMSLGILIYGIACWYVFPSYDSYMLSGDESILVAMYGGNRMKRFFTSAKVLLHVGLLGSISSVVSLILVTIVRDCFLSLTLPMMLIYLSTKVCNYYTLYVRQKYADDSPLAVDMIRLLIPSTYIDMERTFHQWFGVPDILWHMYLLVLIGILAVMMVFIVKRRNV